jgi:hypothetical protein
MLLADSKNDTEELSKLEEQYNILSCSSFAKYDAFKFYKSEIQKKFTEKRCLFIPLNGLYLY